MTDWDKIPVAQKSSLIRMFVENGITDVNKMRHIYANGGVMEEPDTQDVMQEPQQDTLPGDYDQWMNSMALKLSEMSGNSYIFTLCDIADDRDFNYSQMYNDNPQYAWSLLDDNNPDFYEIGKMIYGEPEPVVEEIEQISDTEGDITQNEYADGGELEHPVPPEYNDMARVLTERYKNLNFVQRALNPDDYPYIENENGDRVTHLMEVSDDGAGNYFIYPTVVQQDTNSDLEVLDGDDAFSHAMRTGEYITVPNKDFAIWYSNNGLIDHLHDSEGNEYAEGGRIHIKKENRGKFTEAAKRAGKSVQEYARQILANKERYSPTLVKRANFARNASKWHDDGGFLNPDDPPHQIKPVDFIGQVAQGQVERGVTQADKTRVVTPVINTEIKKEVEAVRQRNQYAKQQYPYLTEKAAVEKIQEDEVKRQQNAALIGNNMLYGEQGLKTVTPILPATVAGVGALATMPTWAPYLLPYTDEALLSLTAGEGLNYVARKSGYDSTGDWIGRGLNHGDKVNPTVQMGLDFLNPGYWAAPYTRFVAPVFENAISNVGKIAEKAIVSPFERTINGIFPITRSKYSPQMQSHISRNVESVGTKTLPTSVSTMKALEFGPFMYDEAGNFIGNPRYNYRQGSGLIEDAIKSGVIRGNPNPPKPIMTIKRKDGSIRYIYPKTFEHPMWNQGSLFMGNNPNFPDLIVAPTSSDWVPANAGGGISSWANINKSKVQNRRYYFKDGNFNIPAKDTRFYRFNVTTNKYEPYTGFEWNPDIQSHPEVNVAENYKYGTAKTSMDLDWNSSEQQNVQNYLNLTNDDMTVLNTIANLSHLITAKDLNILSELVPNNDFLSMTDSEIRQIAQKEYKIAKTLKSDKEKFDSDGFNGFFNPIDYPVYNNAERELVNFYSSSAYKDRATNRLKSSEKANELINRLNENLSTVKYRNPADLATVFYKDSEIKLKAKGSYRQDKHTIGIKKGADENVAIHEGVHASDKSTGLEDINVFVKDLKIKENAKKVLGENNFNYLTEPSEIRARAITILQDFRRRGVDINNTNEISKEVEKLYSNPKNANPNFQDLTFIYDKISMKKLLRKILSYLPPVTTLTNQINDD